MILFEHKQDCCGCGACANICPKGAISMQPDEEGFLYPVIDSQKCVDCGACLRVCPLRQPRPEGDAAPLAFGAKHRMEEVRMQSTSGGLFTALSEPFLREDGVIYGAAMPDARTVRHIRADHRAGRDSCRGSKYCQSDTGDTFARVKADLLAGRQVLYTGSPCQIAGLRTFLGRDYDNLTTVDFVCHGVPSPLLYRQYIDFLEEKTGAAVAAYVFRPKDRAWGSKKGHVEKAILADGRAVTDTMASNVWKHLFFCDLALRPSCHRCRFSSLHRPGDLTIADFWGVNAKDPAFADGKGVSFVLVNSDKGLTLLDSVRGQLELLPCVPGDNHNPNLRRPTPCPAGREQFWQTYAAGGFAALSAAYGQYSPKGFCKRLVKKLLGRA